MRPSWILLALLAGCALKPAGQAEERERSLKAGKVYQERAPLPALTEQSGPEDYLQTAFQGNAELESRYWAWRAALEEIPQVGSWTNPSISYGYMFRPDNMKAWDRTTLGVSNDAMFNLVAPAKLAAAGRRALEQARAAGLRFEEAKFVLQGRVLSAYYELALLAESLRIQGQAVELTRQALAQVEVRARTGAAGLQDLLAVQTELELAQNELENLRAQVPPLVARSNALLGRGAREPLALPASLPPARPLSVADAELIRVAAERSPGLAALAREVAGQEQALSLARQAYIPDFGLSFSLTGNQTRMGEGMLTLPLRLEAIRAGIEQARAGLRAVRAARLQYERDLAASFVLRLYVLRNTERQIGLFDRSIVDRAGQTVELAQTAYAAGRASYGELLQSQRALLDARLALAQLRTEREQALAAIETWSAVDIEVMSGARPALRAVGSGTGSGAGMGAMK